MSLFPVIVEHDYKIGEAVTGRDCDGRPFSGRVTDLGGRFSVFVDGVFTPCSLIDGNKTHRTPPTKIGEIEWPKAPPTPTGGIFD